MEAQEHPTQGLLEPVQRGSVADAVLKQLVGLLHSGAFTAGDRLPSESQLMDEMRVSRPPVREALQALVGMGVVEKRQGSGHYVRALGLDDLLRAPNVHFVNVTDQVADIVEARLFLEVEIIAKVVREVSDEGLEPLQVWLRQMRQAVAAGEYTSGDSGQFHILLAELSGNRVLPELIGFLGRLGMQAEDEHVLAPFDPAWDLGTHEELLRVIGRRNEADARRAMQEHIRTALERARRRKSLSSLQRREEHEEHKEIPSDG